MPAPAKSTRPGVRIGDSGTNRMRGDRGADAHDRGDPEDPVVAGAVDEHAAERQADALPIAAIAPSMAMPVGTFSRGNSSRMIPNESGKTPPPRPCSAAADDHRRRALLDSAHTTEPTANSASEIASSRSLPNMSPRRPKIGVAIEATSR